MASATVVTSLHIRFGLLLSRTAVITLRHLYQLQTTTPTPATADWPKCAQSFHRSGEHFLQAAPRVEGRCRPCAALARRAGQSPCRHQPARLGPSTGSLQILATAPPPWLSPAHRAPATCPTGGRIVQWQRALPGMVFKACAVGRSLCPEIFPFYAVLAKVVPAAIVCAAPTE